MHALTSVQACMPGDESDTQSLTPLILNLFNVIVQSHTRLSWEACLLLQ